MSGEAMTEQDAQEWAEDVFRKAMTDRGITVRRAERPARRMGVEMIADVKAIPGKTRVKIDGAIPALVTGVAWYSPNRMLYECSWFWEGERHSEWLEETEIVFEPTEETAGFRVPSGQA